MGSGAGMGVEARRADGRAVRFFAGARWMLSGLLVGVVLGLFATACSQQKPETAPDPATRLRALPAADLSKLGALRESKHWSNPYVVIRPDRVGLLTGVAANEEQILKPDEVVKALAQLPASAWPYGRAVAILVDERATSSDQDKVALRRNRGIVAGELESALVAIQWIPSS